MCSTCLSKASSKFCRLHAGPAPCRHLGPSVFDEEGCNGTTGAPVPHERGRPSSSAFLEGGCKWLKK